MAADQRKLLTRTVFPAAAIAGLLLAGCSSGHVGEAWQCPLAEGGTCDSVAAADPAVPDPKAAASTVLAEPLWRVRPTEPASQAPPPAREPGQASETVCETGCGGGFDPFGWLAQLIGGGADEAESARKASPAAGDVVRVETVSTPAAPADGSGSRPAGPATTAIPAQPNPTQDDPGADDLRTGEVVARIWIAPFVDGNGVYREASYVRVVLEPAGWRLP